MRPCTNKAERKIHEESGRKGREAIKSDCAPGRGLRKREITQVEILLRSAWFEPPMGVPGLWSKIGKMSPLGWWEGW